MRILVAARLSQLADGQTGLDTQDAQATAWAAANGHTIVHVAADRKSGTSQPWERPKLRPWVTEDAKLAQYDAVLAYRFDRLSRGDNQSTNQIEAWAHDHRKQLLTVDGLVFPCEGADGIRWDVVKRIAHEEWLKTSERYTRMQAYLVGEGKLTGRPPFGYQVAPAEGGHKTLIPTDEGRTYVPQIYQRCIDGESLASIAKWLDSEGVKPVSGKRWWPKSIGDILRCTTYTGRRQDASGKTILRVEALVDSVTFRLAGEALDSRPKRGPTNAANASLLSGYLLCYRCDNSPMYRVMCGGARGAKSAYYRCSGRGTQRKGCGNMVRADAADELMNAVMSGLTRPEIDETLVPGHDHAAELEDIKLEMRELAARDLTDAQYDAELARLRAERDRLASLPSIPDRWERRPTGRTYGEAWQSLDLAGRRAWLRDLARFTVYGDKYEPGTWYDEDEDEHRGEMFTRMDAWENGKAALIFQWDGDYDEALYRGLPADDDDEE